MEGKRKFVRTYFEDPQLYLGSGQIPLGIKARIEVISAMIGKNRFDKVLDAPCGNGMISRGLRHVSRDFTLVDLSKKMIDLAKENIGDIIKDKSFLLGDVMEMDSASEFDLILAVGILAHVDSPSAFIRKIDSMLVPGGILIIQNTDDSHWKIKLQKVISGTKALSQSGYYELNAVTHAWLMSEFSEIGYELVCLYRYDTVIPGFKVTREYLDPIWKVFGTPPKNSSLSFLGSKCIYKFMKL